MSTITNPLVQPYLNFNGRCEEALEYYRQALDAEITGLMRFKDSPEPPAASIPADKVMHSQFRIGDATIMASDGCCSGPAAFAGFSLTVTVPDEVRAQKYFAALSEGGQVTMPLAKTFWSPLFGMVSDRFGVSWMIMVASSCPDQESPKS